MKVLKQQQQGEINFKIYRTYFNNKPKYNNALLYQALYSLQWFEHATAVWSVEQLGKAYSLY